MSFEQDNKNRREWADPDAGWTKEQARRDDRFDFAAFLGPESLEDRITDALDGKDLLDEEAFGKFAPDYVPRRGQGNGRGRHEAPGPDPEEEEEPVKEEAPEPAFSDFEEEEPVKQQRPQPQRPVYRDEPPPRPKVVVADPAYSGGGRSGYGGPEPPRRGGNGFKWLMAIVIAGAIIVGLSMLVSGLLSGGGTPGETPDPSATDFLSGLLRPENTPMQATPTPAPTPVPTPTPARHTITVTSGPGGYVTPTGSVDVEEGGTANFIITPDIGYEIGQLIVDGSNVSIQSNYSFYDVRKNHTLYVVFQAVPVTPPPTEVPVITPEPPPMVTEEPMEPPVSE